MTATLTQMRGREHSALNAAVGAEVDGLRNSARLTQKQLAERTAPLGVSLPTLQRIEAGTTAINMDHLDAICTVLNEDPVELLRRARRRVLAGDGGE